MTRSLKLIAVFLAILVPGTAGAQSSFDDGVTAYSLQDYERAFEIWQPLAAQGDTRAQLRLAELYELGFGIEQDNEKAAYWYRKAAEGGDTDAQLAYAYLLLGGRGVAENKMEAADWLRRVARKGSPKAQFELGALYLLGEGVERDLEQALFWFQMAAETFPEGPERDRASRVLEDLEARIKEESGS